MRQVIVTGGGTGIGREIARGFSRAGDRVTLTGRREQVLARTAGELDAGYVAFDASDPTAVEAALPRLPDRVDVLVNNAGGLARPDTTGVEGLAAVAAGWRAALETNLLSAVLITEALIPRLVGGGAIVSLGSIAARRGGGAYGAAKAALEAWTAAVAGRLGPRGITANVVSPGFTEETEFFADGLPEQRRQRLVAETLTGRAGTPGDVAAVVRFICSPEAGHLTGQVIHVNGGAYLGR